MLDEARSWFSERLGEVRLRQLTDRLRHRLSFLPMLYVVLAAVVVQVLLLFDNRVGDNDLPVILTTTVDSARSVFSAMAGGLITSITLLLSMMLVAVQLASSQFSPRTLREWLGDRTLQHAIGIVLGTTVFCLLALRSTRSLGDEGSVTTVPHVTVLVAVALGVVSLIAVVRAVDHITDSLRIGSITRRIAADTIAVIHASERLPAGQNPHAVPAGGSADVPDRRDDRQGGPEAAASGAMVIPADARAIEIPVAGWLQQADDDTILDVLPDEATGYVVAPLGAFVTAHAPVMWVSPAPPDDHRCINDLLSAFAFGDTRTLQEDVAFGILQLTDIAVRALSPGVNDPNTANDVIVHLGHVLTEVWSRAAADHRRTVGGRTVVRYRPGHGDLLEEAFGPIRRHGRADPTVVTTLARTVLGLQSEVERRGLPGPVEPLVDFLVELECSDGREAWTDREVVELDRLLSRSFG